MAQWGRIGILVRLQRNGLLLHLLHLNCLHGFLDCHFLLLLLLVRSNQLILCSDARQLGEQPIVSEEPGIAGSA